jgi:hypothetical protein
MKMLIRQVARRQRRQITVRRAKSAVAVEYRLRDFCRFPSDADAAVSSRMKSVTSQMPLNSHQRVMISPPAELFEHAPATTLFQQFSELYGFRSSASFIQRHA